MKQVQSHSIRFIATMYTLTLFFGLFLAVRTEPTVGSSYDLFSNIAKAPHFQNVFQKMTPTVVRIDRGNASESYLALYDRMLKLDGKLASVVDNYVDANLKAYNRVVYEYLGKIVQNGDDDSRLGKALETIGFGGGGRAECDFRFLAYLTENGIETGPKYDNLLFYVYIEPSKWSGRTVLERIKNLCGVGCENGFGTSLVTKSDVNFEELTNQVKAKLTKIKRNFFECSNVLHGVRDPWINFGDLFWDLKSKEGRIDKDLFRIECQIQKRKSGTQDVIDNWNCDNNLVKKTFGFISLLRVKNVENGGRLKTFAMQGASILSNFQNQRIKNTTLARKHHSDLNVESTSVENLNLRGLKKLIAQNLTLKNVQGFFGMMSEIYMLLTGKASELLLNGAFHMLEAKCTAIKIDQYNVQMVLHHINVTNFSLRLFYRLFKRIVRKVNVKWSVDMGSNVYMRNMENNLYQMIRILSINNYAGRNDVVKLASMQTALMAEYGSLIKPTNQMSTVDVKLNLIAKSIDSLKDILYVLQ